MPKYRFTYDKLQVRYAAQFLKDQNPTFATVADAEKSILKNIGEMAIHYPETFARSTGGYLIVTDPITPQPEDEEIFFEVWVNPSVCRSPVWADVDVKEHP